MGEALRVLVVDDHPLYRDGLRALLTSLPGIDLVGEAEDGDAAVRLAATLTPDVVLMDLGMPGRSGIDATRAITAHQPGVGVLVLTMFEDDDSVFSAMRAGARGYLLKDVDRDGLARAIESIGTGGAIFGAGVARRVQTFFAASANLRIDPFPDLTPREREVLDRIARGESNSIIAARLSISGKTVRNHVSTILGKLMVVDRSQAIVRAREAGLGSEPPGRRPNGVLAGDGA